VSTADPDKRFRYFLDQPFGLKWHRDFARQRGKPISYPEWGVGTRPDGHGVGDDPVSMEKMADWFEEDEPLYQSYWDVEAADVHGVGCAPGFSGYTADWLATVEPRSPRSSCLRPADQTARMSIGPSPRAPPPFTRRFGACGD